MPKHQGSMSYTRQKYIHGIPQSKIRVFTLGDKKTDYSHVVLLKPIGPTEIGSGALEAARVTANKVLENAGKPYLLKMLIYPHEIVREHRFMGFAGADRLSQGMSRSFGRTKSRTAKVDAGQVVLAVYVKSDAIDLASTALKRASKKLPLTYGVSVEGVKAEEAERHILLPGE